MKNRFLTPDFIFIMLTALFCSVSILHTVVVGKSVYGDGRYYVSMLDSVVRDRDLDMTNQFRMFSVLEPKTVNNVPAQKYPIGFSILLFPLYTFLQYFIIGYKIYPLFVQFCISIFGSLTAVSGLFFLWMANRKIYGEKIAVYTTVSIALCTNLFFYGAVDTVNSHPYSFFLASVLLAVLSYQRAPLPVGIFAGLLYLVRPQDLVCSVPAFIRKPNIKYYAVLLIPICCALILQSALTYRIFGSLTVSGYFQSGREGFFSSGFHPLDVLFSPTYGIFTVTPIVAISLVGLFTGRSTTKMIKTGSILVFLIQLFIVSSWSTWSQGASYSGRMFVSTLPFLSFGLSGLYGSLRKLWNGTFIITMIIVSFALLNMLSIVRFLLINP